MWNELRGKFTSSNWRTWPVELTAYLGDFVSMRHHETRCSIRT